MVVMDDQDTFSSSHPDLEVDRLEAQSTGIFLSRLRERDKKVLEKVKNLAQVLPKRPVPRLVGGYVRDLLMGIDCSDLDIALDNMTGFDFATEFALHYADSSNPSKISANPEKSKHLETAVLGIDGVSIDFINLRSEEYGNNTRIPTMSFGTAEQDALRRDITINALFYNLNTGKIEDYTRRGLTDLRERRIDTPMDPLVTLFDDPLRILRIFRFRAKLGFTIAPRIYNAIAHASIRSALALKVTRDRIGIEIEKMIGYSGGETGIAEILESRYVGEIFGLKTVRYIQEFSPIPLSSASADDRTGSMRQDESTFHKEEGVSSSEAERDWASLGTHRVRESDRFEVNLTRSLHFFDTFKFLLGVCSEGEKRIALKLGEPALKMLQGTLPRIHFYLTNCNAAIASGTLGASHAHSPLHQKLMEKRLPSIDQSILRLYIILHNFTGNKAVEKKRPIHTNVRILHEGLRFSKKYTKVAQRIEEGIELARTVFKDIERIAEDELIGFVLETKELWPMILITKAIIDDSPTPLSVFRLILEKGYENCFSTLPLVTGNDLKERLQPREISAALRRCHIIQVQHSTDNKRTVLKEYFGNSQQSP